MSSHLLARRLRVLRTAALCSVTLVPNLWAEPITVTSGRFVVPFDDPTFLSISGTDGFTMSAGFLLTPTSPQRACFFGCAPGSAVSMAAVVGGASAGFRVGELASANISGSEFGTGRTGITAPRLIGTLAFDAPTLTLPPLNPSGALLAAPFLFNAQVTGFAPEDVDARVPLFHVTLVGQGTMTAFFEFSDAGSWVGDEVIYTFAPNADPIPEPTTVALFGSGLIGMVARAWKRKRTRRELA